AILDYADGEWEGDDLDITLAPGEGAFFRVPTAWTKTFIGEVLTGNLSIAIPTGYSIISSKIPLSGRIQEDLSYPALNGDFVYKFNPPAGGYIVWDFVDGDVDCDGTDCLSPVISFGEAFYLKPTTP